MRDYTYFRFWCQKVLPLVYDNSLSYYEVLCKCVDYLNNLITDTKTLSTEVAELAEYVSHLDVDIRTIVDETLRQMLADGDFDSIINTRVDDKVGAALDTALDEIDDKLGDAIDEVDEKLDAALDEIDEKLDEALDTVQDSIADLTAKCKAMPIAISRYGRLLDDGRFGGVVTYDQGCTWDGTYYYVAGGNNSGQGISKFNSAGEIIDYETHTMIGHANDICYFNNKLYVAPADNYIAVINPTTLAYESQISLSSLSNSYSCTSLTTDGEKLYALIGPGGSQTRYVYEVDGSTFTQLFTITFRDSNIHQAFEYYNGKFYFAVNEPNCIYEVETDGTLSTMYYVPSSDGYFPLGEIESLLVKDGQLYLCCTAGYSEDVWSYFSYRCAESYQLFACSINDGIMSGTEQVMQPLKLALTVNGSMSHVFNPISTFSTVEEACWVLNAHGYGRINIQNVSKGMIFLSGGVYSVIGDADPRTVTNAFIFNSDTTLNSLVISNYLYIYKGSGTLANCTLSCAISTSFASVKMENVRLGSLQSMAWVRTDFDIVSIEDNINASATFTRTGDPTGSIRFMGRCRTCLNKILNAQNRAVMIDIAIPHLKTPMISLTLDNDQLTADVNRATGDTDYPYFKISNDTFYLIASDTTPYNLSGSYYWVRFTTM